jgi:hypothetical protein
MESDEDKEFIEFARRHLSYGPPFFEASPTNEGFHPLNNCCGIKSLSRTKSIYNLPTEKFELIIQWGDTQVTPLPDGYIPFVVKNDEGKPDLTIYRKAP